MNSNILQSLGESVKIVLIHPPSPYLLIPKWSIPNTLLILKTFLESYGSEVELVDLSDATTNEYLQKIPLDAKFYGISGYTVQHEYIKKISNYIKSVTSAIIIAGGRHVTFIHEDILNDSAIDIVIRGEGELTFLDVLRGTALEDIPGISYKKDGKIYINKDRPLIKNLDTLPYPRLEGLDLKEYPGTYINMQHSKYRIGVIFSRGCYGNCAFCCSVSFWQRSVRFNSYEWIEKYVHYLTENNVFDIHINDDNFLIHKDFFKICELLRNNKIMWKCMGTSKHITLKRAKKLAECGCYKISLGIESGSDKLLKLMGKETNVIEHYRAINILKEAEVYVEAYMLLGFPGTDQEDIDSTIEFIKRANVDEYSLSTFVPFPGTKVWADPGKYKCSIDNQKSYKDYHHLGKEVNIKSVLTGMDSLEKHRAQLMDAMGDRNIICKKLKENILIMNIKVYN